MAAVSFYKSDLKEMEFTLFEQFRLAELFAAPPYDQFSEEDARMILKEAHHFAQEVIGPTMGETDRQGCELTPEGVKVPQAIHDLWRRFYENGWNALELSESAGGQGAPRLLGVAVTEMMSGANTAFHMYLGLSLAAAAVLRAFGTPDQRELYAGKMEDGTWGGTMVLTEPQAGSDVGLSLTKATPNGNGSYLISGSKIFISGGDHDLTENIVHLVLARIEGAPKGTRGLSLFLIPKIRVNADGSLGESNDVTCTHIEHKLGIHASATAALTFGENGKCVGYLLGGEPTRGGTPGEGMRKMFVMMNGVRIGVAVQSLGVASTAYLNALAYARTRLQGAHMTKGRGEKGAVPIIEHSDVRRMLMEMKAIVEGCRALIFHAVRLHDRARMLAEGEERAALEDDFDLYIPLAKAHVSDMAVNVASTALQVYGGAGYTGDYPAEQYLRDSRIFPIYEGTNGIQAMDLVGRKLSQNQGAAVGRFGKELQQLVKTLGGRAGYESEAATLAAAGDKFNAVLEQFLEQSLKGGMEQVALSATPFLHAMAQIAIARLLLEGALIAEDALAKVDEGSQDGQFYRGKIAAARYYARNILPPALSSLDVVLAGDTSALDIPEGGFSLAY
ncbi:MAG: acyl-CoA dehydrogenase [SAR324 cluster bacterium]|nr:acyl-CoA dehydrogenase [SAR324 cluster bacterium]